MPLLPRTLLLLDEPFEESGGRFYCPMTWWRFAEKLAAHCTSATLYVPLARNVANPRGFAADIQRLRVTGRPYYRRLKDFYLRLPAMRARLRRQARQLVAEHDVVIVRVPAPAAKFVVQEASRTGKPLVMLVGGDITRASSWVANQSGARAWVGRVATYLLRRQERDFARRCVFIGTSGAELQTVFRPYCPRVEVWQDPNIEARHLRWREDTCMASPVRLIRVGRLLPTKGLEYLLAAVAELKRSGCPARLDIVGDGDDRAYSASLQRRACELGITELVTFHGAVAFGEELFAKYWAADLHVISSLSEGMVRCIAEGRAFCLPTVATNVGGIPSNVQDGVTGLLVPPGDAEALAAAIRRLVEDGALRRRIIRTSFELAKQSTSEYHAEQLARRIADAMESSYGPGMTRGA